MLLCQRTDGLSYGVHAGFVVTCIDVKMEVFKDLLLLGSP